jgi:hypothetical protein
LIAFVKRQTGLDAVQFLRFAGDARKAIEALKAILAREGGVDWSPSRFQPEYTQVDGYRIAKAQWHNLGGEKAMGQFPTISRQVAGRGANDLGILDSREWIIVMNHFGKLIREQKAQS